MVAVLLEAGGSQPAVQGGGVAAGDLVFAQHLEELEVAELAGLGLAEAGVEGVEHPGQAAGSAGRSRADGCGSSTPAASVSNSALGTVQVGGGGRARRSGPVSSRSVPAARIPLTVR